VNELRATLDPVRLLNEIRAVQQQLVETADRPASGETEKPTLPTMNGTLCTISPLMKWTSRQSLELGDDDRAPRPPGGRQCGGEDRPPLQRVRSPRALHLDERVAYQLVALAHGECFHDLALRLQPEPAPALPLGTGPVISEGGRPRRPLLDHWISSPASSG
jgi:hypothetical protein